MARGSALQANDVDPTEPGHDPGKVETADMAGNDITGIEPADVGDVVPANPGPGTTENAKMTAANQAATNRKRGGARSRKDIQVFIFYSLEGPDGSTVDVPAGTVLVIEEVTRDVVNGYRRAAKGNRLYADLTIPATANGGNDGAPGGNPANAGNPPQEVA